MHSELNESTARPSFPRVVLFFSKTHGSTVYTSHIYLHMPVWELDGWLHTGCWVFHEADFSRYGTTAPHCGQADAFLAGGAIRVLVIYLHSLDGDVVV
jgi:hypothetical protein